MNFKKVFLYIIFNLVLNIIFVYGLKPYHEKIWLLTTIGIINLIIYIKPSRYVFNKFNSMISSERKKLTIACYLILHFLFPLSFIYHLYIIYKNPDGGKKTSRQLLWYPMWGCIVISFMILIFANQVKLTRFIFNTLPNYPSIVLLSEIKNTFSNQEDIEKNCSGSENFNCYRKRSEENFKNPTATGIILAMSLNSKSILKKKEELNKNGDSNKRNRETLIALIENGVYYLNKSNCYRTSILNYINPFQLLTFIGDTLLIHSIELEISKEFNDQTYKHMLQLIDELRNEPIEYKKINSLEKNLLLAKDAQCL